MRYEALDSWRGICALMVVFSHARIASHFYINDFVRHSFLFVDFFFVLSGFVIALNYQEKLLKGYGVAPFMALRLGRVWPLHVVLLGLYVLAELVLLAWPWLQGAIGRTAFDTDRHSVTGIFTHLTLIHSLPNVHEDVTWNEPSWSISVEFYSYLIFALGLAVLSRLPFKRMLLVVGLIGVLVAAPIVIYMLAERKNIFVMASGGLIRCLYGFAAGALAAMIHQRWQAQHIRLFANRGLATLLEFAAFIGTIAFVTLVGISSWNLTAPIVFALVILVFAPQAGHISDVLRMRPLLYLGTLSYSIYMVHYLILALLYWLQMAVKQATGFPIFDYVPGYEVPDGMVPGAHLLAGDLWVLSISGFVVLVSASTYARIETPGRAWGRRLADRLTGKSAIGTPSKKRTVA
jgi:peptidoglycan/LPS O-acetylase OafA/YrhL